jgi:arabinogalactan endo-1,4-beta-galactosidase
VADFREAGALPHYIQIGHDLSGGFLDARVAPDSSTAAWDRLAERVGAALAGAKVSAPGAKTVLRLGGSDAVWCAAVVDSLAARDVRFDLVGISWLPWYEGTLTQLKEALALLSPHAPGGLLVLETAYPWTLRGFDDTLDEVGQPAQLHPGYDATPQGQALWFADVLAAVRATPPGCGVFWGDPFSIAARGVGTSRENLALFDQNGTALPALTVGR